jgi:hypothetical protein
MYIIKLHNTWKILKKGKKKGEHVTFAKSERKEGE